MAMTADQQRVLARAEAVRRAQEAKAAAAADMSIWGRVKDNVMGSPDGVQSTGEALGTWLNRAGESATLGVVGDEASALATGILPGRSYDEELSRYRANEAAMSMPGRLSADLAGALVPGVGMAGGAMQATGWAGKAAAGAGLGAASGGVYGFAEGEGADDRLSDGLSGALFGGGIGLVVPAAGGLAGALARSGATNKAVKTAAKGAPTSAEMKAQGQALYKAVEDAGVEIKPEAFDAMRARLVDALRTRTGYDELPGPGSLTPYTARAVEIMDQAGARMAAEPTAALPFRSLDQMRRQAGAAAGNVTNKVDQSAGMVVKENLDEFVQRLGPDDVSGGDIAALQTAIPKAREVWSRMSKSQTVDDAIDRAENYLGGSASGLRNQFKNILQNKKLASQFTPAEKAALRMVTHGNKLDQIINLAGGGLSQIGAIGAGGAIGGIPGAAIGAAAGSGARSLSEALMMKRAETARAAIASGALQSPAVLTAIEEAARKRALLVQALGFGAVPSATGSMPSR